MTVVSSPWPKGFLLFGLLVFALVNIHDVAFWKRVPQLRNSGSQRFLTKASGKADINSETWAPRFEVSTNEAYNSHQEENDEGTEEQHDSSSEEEHEHDEEEGEEGEHEHGFNPNMLSTAVLVITVALILFTIGFEEGKALIEEHSDISMKPIIESLFKEMTTLGFLSVVVFLLTRGAWDESISEYMFGEHEKGLLIEVLEAVHYVIFFVMIFFVLQVLMLVNQGMAEGRQWVEMNESCQAADQDFPLELSQFRTLRNEFILERSVEPPFAPTDPRKRVSDDFNFGKYLELCQGVILGHIVEVNIWTWTFFVFLSIIFYLIAVAVNTSLPPLAWCVAGAEWGFFVFNIIFENHLKTVLKAFTETDASFLGLPLVPEAEQEDAENTDLIAKKVDPSLPAWCKIDLSKYQEQRSWLVKKISPKLPDRQGALYWCERAGPGLSKLILQINLIWTGFYVSLLSFGLIPMMVHLSSWQVSLAYVLFSFFPLLWKSSTKRRVALLTMVTCIGTLRRPQMVTSVIRGEKTAQIVSAFIILYKLHRAVTDGFNDDGHFGTEHGLSDSTLQTIEMKEISKTFDLFDTNDNGYLSKEELKSVMNSVGASITDEIIEKIMSVLDVNGDGTVSKKEFMEWFADQMSVDRYVSFSERAKYIFSMFDEDGTGEITLGEFKNTLDAFDIGFSVDDIGELVKELDREGTGTIGHHEFTVLLEKYHPAAFG